MMEMAEEYRANLPDSAQESIIQGGCHAGFGNYGTQEGDGTPAITSEEQIQITVAQCLAVME